MSTALIITLSTLYVLVSPVSVWFMQSRFRGSLLEKLITLISTPGCLFILFFIAGPLSIPYFWLYRERHRTTIDFHGTEDEKADMQAYRAALSRETFLDRIRYFTGFTPASANRLAADQAIMQTWERYHSRKTSTDPTDRDDKKSISTTEGEQNAGGNGSWHSVA